MQSNQFIEEMGLLAELSYVNFEDISLSKNNIDWINNAKEDIKNKKDARKEILIKLLETYEIVDFKSFDTIGESDLQMMLLKDRITGEYVISYRGTASIHDAIITDVAQMGLKLNDNDQFKDSLTVTNDWKELYGLNSSNTTLTGHSLGGTLAQLNSYVFGFETYTINAFGFDAATTGGTINMGVVLENIGYQNMGVQNTDNIYNFISESGVFRDFISGDLTDIVGYFSYTHIGETIILKDSSGGYLGLIGSHSSVDINNTLEIYHNLMTKFNLGDNYDILTNIIDNYKVELFGNQMNDFLKDLSKIFNITLTENLNMFSKEVLNIEQNLSINFLKTKTQAELKNTSVANLYALENLNPFLIEGDLAAYQNIDTSKYTEQYLEDRSQYLYYLLDKENRYDIDSSLSMTMYQDLNLGEKYTLSQSFSQSKIIFGGNSFDYIEGAQSGDRLYGNNGDILFGYSGDDILVSNYDSKILKGETKLQGGSGSDTYIISENTINNINDSNIENNKIKLNFEMKSIDVIIINNSKYITLNDNTFIVMNNEAISEMEFSDGYILTSEDLKNLENNKTKEEKENILQYVKENIDKKTLIESLFNGNNVNYENRNNFLTNLGYVSTYKKFDPLVIDLNNDNQIDLISETNSNIYFDMNNDSIKEKTSWLGSNEGFIVIDKNENNTIDNLNELMGESNLSGLEELKTYDLNGDGVINLEDDIFSKIKVWQDLNSDAISQTNELFSLNDLNIVEIDLNSTQVSIILDGGEITELSTVSLSNNETMITADVNLNVSDVYKEYSYENINNFDISTLFYLNMKGYGTIKDSIFAYNENNSLKSLLSDFETKNRIDNVDIIKFLTKWTNSEALTGVEYNSGDLSINEKVWILESFTNQDVFKTQIENYYKYNYQLNTSLYDTYSINKAFYALKERYLNLFNVSKFIKENDLYDKIYYSTECDNFIINDINFVNNYVVNNFNTENGDFLTFIHMIQDNLSIENFTIEKLGYDNYKLMEKILDNSYMNIKIVNDYELTYNKTILIDNELNNSIYLTNQEVFIFDMEGDDTISGLANKYIYLIKNHGNDILLNHKSGDVIEFSNDINKNDIKIEKINNDLKIYTSENNSIILKDWYSNTSKVNKFVFSDGSFYNETTILTALTYFTATIGNDNITTYNGNDIIDGLGGNDTIIDYGGFNNVTTGDGNDIIKMYNSSGNFINTGAGDDNIYITTGENTIYAGAGNDIVQGNTGNDIIYAGAGNDNILTGAGNNIVYLEEGNNKVYVTASNFNDKNKIFLGIGNDTVTGNDNSIDTIIVGSNSCENLLKTLNKNDIIEFDSTVNKDKIRVEAVSNGVKIYTDNKLDNYILIEYWNAGSSNALNTFKFSDNTVLNKTNINSLIKVISGTNNSENINSTGNNLIYSKNGNDIINNISGNNEYLFNIGDGIDTINDNLNTGKILFSKNILKEDISIFKDENNIYHIAYSNEDEIVFNGEISNIELNDSNFITNNDINKIIQDMNIFAAENDFSINSIDDVKNNQNLMQIISNSFHN